MLTKKEFCQALLKDAKNRFQFEKDEEAHQYIAFSSKLAVACQYLGLLTKQDEIEYCSGRAGILYSVPIFDDDNNFSHVEMLTVREIIQLLPDTQEDKIAILSSIETEE